MATVADVLAVARAELGNTRGAKYFNYFGEADLGAWCVAYARYVEHKAGCPIPWPYWFAWDSTDKPILGSAYRSKWDLQPGEALGFDWDTDGLGDHVGVVTSVHDWGCCTIEGNTSYGVVKEQQRVWDNITCGIHPPKLDGSVEPTVLDDDGACGHATVREWQRQMGTDPDGVVSNQLWHNDQYRRCVWAIDHYHLDYQDYAYQGSSLVRAVQRRLGIGVDGDWGPGTTTALQRKLKEWGYYSGKLDRDFGEGSVKALQRSLNDGRWK